MTITLEPIDASVDVKISSLALVVCSQNEFKKRQNYRELWAILPLLLTALPPEGHPEHHHLDQPFKPQEGKGWRSCASPSETNNPEIGA